MKYFFILLLSFTVITPKFCYAQFGIGYKISKEIGKAKKRAEANKFEKQVKHNEKLLKKQKWQELAKELDKSIILFEADKNHEASVGSMWENQINAYIQFKTKVSLPALYEKEKELFAMLEQHRITEATAHLAELESKKQQIYKDILPITGKYYTNTIIELGNRVKYYQDLYKLSNDIEETYTRKDVSVQMVQELDTRINEWEKMAGKTNNTFQKMLLDAKCKLNKLSYDKIQMNRRLYAETPQSYYNLNDLETSIKHIEDNLSNIFQIQCIEKYDTEEVEKELVNLKSQVSKLKDDYANEQERLREAQRLTEIKKQELLEKQRLSQPSYQNNSQSTPSRSGNCGPAGVQLHRGSRGGCYYYSGNSKVYVDRSCCQ